MKPQRWREATRENDTKQLNHGQKSTCKNIWWGEIAKKNWKKNIFVFFHREISPMAEKTTSITVTWVSSRLWWTKPELHSVCWNVSKSDARFVSIGINRCFTCITVKQPCTLILPIITWESLLQKWKAPWDRWQRRGRIRSQGTQRGNKSQELSSFNRQISYTEFCVLQGNPKRLWKEIFSDGPKIFNKCNDPMIFR